MRKIEEYVYDNLDKKNERKNLYLRDIAILQKEIKNSEDREKKKLKNKLNALIRDKSKHNYNVKLKEFKEKEKLFYNNLEDKINKYNSKNTYSKKTITLEKRLEKAKYMKSFYKGYINLTYDSQLLYEQSKIEVEQIPHILEFADECERELDTALDEIKNTNSEEEKKIKDELVQFKEQEKKLVKKKIKELKNKYSKGLISSKAKDEGIKTIRRKLKEKIDIKSFESKIKFNKEIINTKKYELDKILNQKIRAVDINVEALRRTYPIEEDKTIPWISYSTVLVPGLGQLLNKQYVKALMMFLGTIFIYLIAIPYALGYGNYKGNGIAGLLTLGLDGGRLNRSMIFMIEGILAIFLLIVALVVLIISFKDVNKVEREKIR